jgi:peptidoglycan/xylan/chitin deacetylase (PgdA/CDA1 family)
VTRPLPRRTLLALLGAGVTGCASTGRADGPAPAGTSSTPPPVTPSAAASTTNSTTTNPAPPSPPQAAPAVEVANGRRDRPEVALTFHASGDPAIATRVLAVLAAGGARATVFVVGTWLRDNPAMAGAITAAGHELANHTWSHPTLENLDEASIRDELQRCRDMLVRVGGTPGAYARQSGAQRSTALIRQVAGSLGYPTVLSYDIDSLDYTDPGSAIVRRQVATATGGSIVSMHFGHQDTVTALPAILGDLSARGLSAVAASTLLRA